MSNLTFNKLKIFDIINKESDTIIRTPEPTEICELDSLYILADWLYDAHFNNIISQERYINLSKFLDTIPIINLYFRNIFIN